MRIIIVITGLILASVSAALAEPSNNTPHALACMKKFGFTYDQWRAYQVPPEKANPYRACRDADASGGYSGKVLASEPPARALPQGRRFMFPAAEGSHALLLVGVPASLASMASANEGQVHVVACFSPAVEFQRFCSDPLRPGERQNLYTACSGMRGLQPKGRLRHLAMRWIQSNLASSQAPTKTETGRSPALYENNTLPQTRKGARRRLKSRRPTPGETRAEFFRVRLQAHFGNEPEGTGLNCERIRNAGRRSFWISRLTCVSDAQRRYRIWSVQKRSRRCSDLFSVANSAFEMPPTCSTVLTCF